MVHWDYFFFSFLTKHLNSMYPSTLKICHISLGKFLLLSLWDQHSPQGRTAQPGVGRQISSAGGSQSLSQLSSAWARCVSWNSSRRRGITQSLYFPGMSLKTQEIFFQMLFILNRLKHSSLRGKTATVAQARLWREYRLVPQIQGRFKTIRCCTTDSYTLTQ